MGQKRKLAPLRSVSSAGKPCAADATPSDRSDRSERRGGGKGRSRGKAGEAEEESEEEEIRLHGRVLHEDMAVTFEFNDMRPEYSESLRVLLRRLVVNPTHAYELACLVTAQTSVGTAIACEGELSVFAFASVLPLPRLHAGPLGQVLAAVAQAAASLLASALASDRATGALLRDALDGEHASTGLLLHCRISNLPLGLVAPMHRNLLDDLAWARTHADDAQEDFARVQNVLLIAACSAQHTEHSAEDVTRRSTVLYDCFDDEILAQQALASVLYRPPHSTSPLVAALIPVAALAACVTAIAELVGSD